MKYNFNQQQGMSLVVVVMLTAIASLLVFTVLNNTVSQSRMSGNFQKAINAEYQADKAIYDAYHKLNQAITTNPEISDAALAEYALIGKTASHDSRYYSTSALSLAEGRLNVTSQGYFYHDSASRNGVLLKRLYSSTSDETPVGPVSPFGYGLVGCSGVALGGSGTISSFHSQGKDYDSPVLVKTYLNGDVTIPGGTAIQGDLLVTGKVTFSGSGAVSGNVHANGGVELTGGTSIAGNVLTSGTYRQTSGYVGGSIAADGNIEINAWKTHSVGGDVSTMGNYTHTGTNVGGRVKANGDVTVTQGTVDQGVQAGRNFHLTAWQAAAIKGDIRVVNNITITTSNNCANPPISTFSKMLYGGSASVPTNLQSCLPAKQNPVPTFLAVTPVTKVPQEGDLDSDGNTITCDALNIAALNNGIKAAIPASAKALEIGYYPHTPYRLMPTHAVVGSFAAATAYQPAEAPVFGLNRMVYFFRNKLEIKSEVNTPGGLVVDGGHVVVFIDGDFVMSGTGELQILDGSSLTLFVTGKVVLGNGKVITPKNKLTADGVPVFSIYSSYSSKNATDYGVTLSGGINQSIDPVYASIYAPLAHINITSGAKLAGSVIGKTVNVNGGATILYDKALGEANIGGSDGGSSGGQGTGNPRVVFSGW